MSDLLNKKCMPCEGGVLPFDVSEIHKYQKKVDGWNITKGKDEIFFLSKKFKFENFLAKCSCGVKNTISILKTLIFDRNNGFVFRNINTVEINNTLIN